MAYQKLQVSRALAVIPSDDTDIPFSGALAITSATTGAGTLKLIDSAGDFINKGVKIGDIIYAGTIASTVTYAIVTGKRNVCVITRYNC